MQHVPHLLVIIAAVEQQVILVVFVGTFKKFEPVIVFRKHVERDNFRKSVIVDVSNIISHGELTGVP